MPFELLAAVATGLFSGAATYITLVEHPARLSCGPAVALAQWRPSYRLATVMQASLAIIGSLSAVAALLVGSGTPTLIAGLLQGAVVPFTFLAIMPTNRQLEEPARDPQSAETETLLRRWGTLHAVRTVLSLLAFGILVVHLFGVVQWLRGTLT